jgi:hypothetical protein
MGPNLPPPAAMTLISFSGTILSKENLPAAIQVKQSDCTIYIPAFQIAACPSLSISVTPSKSLPGRLLFTITKPNPADVTNLNYTPPTTYYSVVFDSNAPKNSPDRWLIIDTKILSGFQDPFLTSLLPPQAVDTKILTFARTSSTKTTVYEIAAKK